MYMSSLITPLGELFITGTHTAICAIAFEREHPNLARNNLTEQAKIELQEYFDLKRCSFTFPIAQPGTDFQQQVWQHLLTIEAGKPISYAALSRKMNHPLAIRAIAAANGKNKLMIVVPCHRVIGSSGKLVGYAGELWRKKWLLEHETALTGIGQSILKI